MEEFGEVLLGVDQYVEHKQDGREDKEGVVPESIARRQRDDGSYNRLLIMGSCIGWRKRLLKEIP